jgi:predicted transposase YbfD/YdcC
MEFPDFVRVESKRPPMSVSHSDVVVVSAVVPQLMTALGLVTDPRAPRGVRHNLRSVLTITVLAMLAGSVSFREIGDYAADLSQDSLRRLEARWCPRQERWLAPSESTLRRTVQDLDADAFDALVCSATRAVEPIADPLDTAASGLIAVAVDGKTARGGWTDDGEVRLFAAMRHDGVVVAQVRVPTHTTEVTQLGPLLDRVELAGWVVTADAAHSHPGFGRYLTRRGGEFLVTVKGNRPDLLAAIVADLRSPDTVAHVQTDRNRGRIIRRTLRVAAVDQVTNQIGYPGARQVFQVVREWFDPDGARRRKEVIHGITSLDAGRIDPAGVATLIREHWHIENKLHYVRDVTFGEDANQTYRGNAAQVMATLRNLAISIINLADIGPVKRTLQRLNRNQHQALALLGL